MVDATKRKLKMPAWHVPYLEKHRILELYRELLRELVIRQPVDHVLFMKQLITNAAEATKVSRVVILCSPNVNCFEVANRMAKITNQKVISDNDVLETNIMKYGKGGPGQIALALSQLTRADSAYKSGWIIVNVIKNGKDAKNMLNVGVLPTHVLHLIPPFTPPLTELLYCNVIEEWPSYRRNITEIREVLKNKLVEVFLGNDTINDVVTKCVELIKIKEDNGGPRVPRVLILGPRGCGRKTQAKLLEANMGLVHIDFEYLLCQAWISETDLGEQLRACRDDVCFNPDILSKVVNQRILQDDCMTKGYVLTCYPFTVADFKYLDTLDTPPNRVVFLECDPSICRERLMNRKINVDTGSVTNITDETSSLWYKHLNQHPKDKLSMINAELSYYCEQYGSMRNYCGNTAKIINADQPKRWVYENIAAYIVRDSPPAPARDPCLDFKQKLVKEEPVSSHDSTPSLLFNAYLNCEPDTCTPKMPNIDDIL